VTRRRRSEDTVPEPVYTRADVLALEQVIPGGYRMEISIEPSLPPSAPGQFVLLKPVGAPFLLPRPLGIFDRSDRDGRTTLELFFTCAGSGTKFLAGRRTGEKIDLLGPLGKPFSVRGRGPVVLVAGGRGIVPLHYLIKRLDPAGQRIVLLFGAAGSELLYPRPERFGCEVRVSTDDGSAGKHGTVVELLQEFLAEGAAGPRPELYCCGPGKMLAAVGRLAAEKKLYCQVSVEAVMACGLGICRGCAVALSGRGAEDGKYGLACTDGPVFEAGELDWRPDEQT